MTRGVVCLVLVACATAPPLPEPVPSELTAARILADVYTTYRQARTYLDHGTQRTDFKASRSFTRTTTFATAFVRGGAFRFEYLEEGDAGRAFVVWSDGKQTLTSWYVRPGVEQAQSLSYAIAAATGVSGGTAHVIPALLEPSVAGGLITSVSEPRRDPDEVIAGRPCWRITGTTRGGTTTLWIDTQTHAIRQVREQRHLAPPGHEAFDVDQLTSYEPALDATVESSRLQPPGSHGQPSPDAPAWLGVMFDGHSGTTRVQSVVAGGPAERAGLQAGDVITKIESAPVGKASDVITRVRGQKPGTKLNLTVSRAGNETQVAVALEKRPDLDDLQGRLVGKPAPDFALAALGGSAPTKLADLKGHVVIVDFWATWCGPCGIAMPHLVDLGHKYKDLRVVGISDEDEADIKRYVADHGIDYTIARDPDDVVTGHYLVTGLPTLVIVDKTGVVRALHVGAGDFDAIEAEVQQYLK